MTRSRLLASFAAVFLLGSLFAAPAAAHDALVASDPPDGAVLEVAPEAIVLEYTGNILDINPALQVTDQDGAEHEVGDAQIDGMFVTWELVDALPAGTFDVIWVVTSSDGHPIDGEFSFTVEGAAEPEPEPEPEETEAPVTEPADEPTAAATEDVTEETPQTSPEPVTDDAQDPEATTDEDAVNDPADISDNAAAWLVAGGAVTLLLLVGVIFLARRNRDPNGPPGQH